MGPTFILSPTYRPEDRRLSLDRQVRIDSIHFSRDSAGASPPRMQRRVSTRLEACLLTKNAGSSIGEPACSPSKKASFLLGMLALLNQKSRHPSRNTSTFTKKTASTPCRSLTINIGEHFIGHAYSYTPACRVFLVLKFIKIISFVVVKTSHNHIALWILKC